MKIAIEARALQGARGVQTYVLELVRHLLRAQSEHQFEIIHATEETFDLLPGADNICVPLADERLLPWWLNVGIQSYIRKNKPDLIHFTKADVPRRRNIPTVVTIHDIIPLILPESQSFLRRMYWPRALRRAAHQSDRIITISNASKQGIVQRLGVGGEKIAAIPLAVNMQHFKPVSDHIKGLPKPYILFVGRWDLRKNIPALIRAFTNIASSIPHQLVIAGRPADRPVDLRSLAAKHDVSDRIIFKENVLHADMPALYSGADLLVFPSLVEGWGFPPQEAMACGTPVIVSNGDPLPEVVGSAGEVVPFSSDDMQERLSDVTFVNRLAASMQKILTDEDMRKRMSAAGLAHVAQYSWEKVAAETLGVYEECAGSV